MKTIDRQLYLNGKYSCPVCGVSFPFPDIVAHCFDAHPEEKWKISLTFQSPAGEPDEESENE